MPKFSANLTLLLNELPFLERFAAAAGSGFKGVECQFPYEFSKTQIVEQLTRHHLTHVLHNLPAGNWSAGERGIACHPGRVDEFKFGVDRAISFAKALDCHQLNCLAGIRPEGVDPATARETFIGNLQFAAARLKVEGIRLLIEPINTVDIPGFFLHNTKQSVEIIHAVGSDNLYLQYDIYHMQIMEGELAPTIASLLPLISHLQLADVPGRNEPGTGEINYGSLLPYIDSLGYNGWIGCEYHPATTTEAGLGWVRSKLT